MYSAQNISSWAHQLTLRDRVAIAAVPVLVYISLLVVYRIWFHPLSKYPGPKLQAAWYLPHIYHNYVVGNGHLRATRLHAKYGPIVRIGPNHLAVDGSIGWRDIYGHKTGKQEFDKFFTPFPNSESSLIIAPKDTHRRIRRQLAHAFSDSALAEQETVVTQYVRLLMDRLTERCGKTVDIVKWFNFTSFDIIGELAYSDSFHSLESNGYHPWVLSIFSMLKSIALRNFLYNYRLLFYIAQSLPAFISPIGAFTKIRGYASEKAVERLGDSEKPCQDQRHKDFMSYMLRDNREGSRGMSDVEIVSTTPTIIIAGSETTATTLAGLVFNLKHNAEAHQALLDEIRGTFATEEEINMKSAAKLPYLQACLHETLRVYPPVPETTPRHSPGALINGDYIPKGTRLSVYQWATYRNPNNFADPDLYRPQRWLPTTHPLYDARYKNDNKDVFKPFSFGARDCIGKNLAMNELRLIASRLLHRFDYELAPGQDDWMASQRAFLLWEKGDLNGLAGRGRPNKAFVHHFSNLHPSHTYQRNRNKTHAGMATVHDSTGDSSLPTRVAKRDSANPTVNLGPLTSTFTPPLSCSSLTLSSSFTLRNHMDRIIFNYGRRCLGVVEATPKVDEPCYPPRYGAAFERLRRLTKNNVYPVFSPASICPSGYTSACGFKSSNATIAIATAEHVINEFEMMMNTLLEETQTAIACCPSAYGCYAIGPYKCIYRPSSGESLTGDWANDCKYHSTPSISSIAASTSTTMYVEAPAVVLVRDLPNAGPKTGTPSAADPTTTAGSDAGSGPKSGLSTGAKAAIGVCVPLFAICAGLLVFVFMRRRSRRALEDSVETNTAAPTTEFSPSKNIEMDGSEPRNSIVMKSPSGVVSMLSDRSATASPGAATHVSTELYGSMPAPRLHEDIMELPAENELPANSKR
ncbi:hypothetical protein MY4824_001457 [Beauveria thailandica]